jgi:uncharacterized membrane protein
MTSLENAIEKSIDVHVPLSTVYNQWTRFEDFPRFMEGVHEVRQLDENRFHWRATIQGQEREWDSEILEQTPDTRIAWSSGGGLVHTGMVSFASIYHGTRVTLQMSHDPELPADERESLAHGMTRNLERFKEFLESRIAETETSAGSG